ncbi:MAG: GDSL-type esterase/lipase family protein [Bacteroidota bacterium]
MNYLALGDSYTIGEGVPIFDSFPYQTVQRLRSAGHAIEAPEIVAKTGWTTDELMNGIKNQQLLNTYSFVSVLIGVNNQYRGRDPQEYSKQFQSILELSINKAGNRPERVVVLSIPDWGCTPFAEGRDRNKISAEIDLFNSINQLGAIQYGVHYIEITKESRACLNDRTLVAADGLHPSGKEYAKWADQLSGAVVRHFK